MVTISFLPDWLPLWVFLAVGIPLACLLVALLLVPFAVFGLKGRLDYLEMQVEDIRTGMRVLAMRLSEACPPKEDRPSVEEERAPPSPLYATREASSAPRGHAGPMNLNISGYGRVSSGHPTRAQTFSQAEAPRVSYREEDRYYGSARDFAASRDEAAASRRRKDTPPTPREEPVLRWPPAGE